MTFILNFYIISSSSSCSPAPASSSAHWASSAASTAAVTRAPFSRCRNSQSTPSDSTATGRRYGNTACMCGVWCNLYAWCVCMASFVCECRVWVDSVCGWCTHMCVNMRDKTTWGVEQGARFSDFVNKQRFCCVLIFIDADPFLVVMAHSPIHALSSFPLFPSPTLPSKTSNTAAARGRSQGHFLLRPPTITAGR